VIRNRRRDLPVAPIRRRLLASLIDLALALVAGILAIGAVTGVIAMRGRKDAPGVSSLTKLTSSKRVSNALRVFTFVLNVLLTGRRGPGSRIVGIRLVDARTGGPLSLRQATLRAGSRQGWLFLVRRLTARLGKAEQFKHRDLQSMYKENQVRPYVSCLPALAQLPLGLAIEAPALWTPLQQGLPDKLAGMIITSDR